MMSLPCPFNNPNFILTSVLPMKLHQLKEIENHVAEASSCHHPSLQNISFYDGTTPLILACKFGELDTVKHLIETWGVSVNALATYDFRSGPNFFDHSKIKINASPLFVASFHGHSRIVHYLLERGADVSVKISHKEDGHFGEFDGWTALHGAVSDALHFSPQWTFREQQEERNVVVRSLLEFGANPNDDYSFICTSGGNPLWAERMCGSDAITALINHEIHDLDLKQLIPWTGRTLLHHVITNRFTEEETLAMIILLVDKGADLMARDKEGWTPLLTAVNYLKCTVLDYLLERDGYNRTMKIEAMELAGAEIFLEASSLLIPKAFEYWRRAYQLREIEKQASGLYSAEKKLGRKIGRHVEWTTLAEIDQLVQQWDERIIEAFLVKLSILSSFNAHDHRCLSSRFMNYRFISSFSTDLDVTLKFSEIVDIRWGMFDVLISHLDPLSTDQDLLLQIMHDVDDLVDSLSKLERLHPAPGLTLFNYETLKTSMDLILLATRPSTLVTNGEFFIKNMFPKIYPLLEMIFRLPELPDERNTSISLTQLLRQLEPYLGSDRLGKLLLSARRPLNSFEDLKFINLTLVRVLLDAGADPNATDEMRRDDNTLLHLVAAMSDQEMGDAAGRLLVGYGAKIDLLNRAGKTAVDIWVEKNETKENWNEELGQWNARPEWCCPVPTLLNLAARVIRVRKLPYFSAPVILHSVVELRD